MTCLLNRLCQYHRNMSRLRRHSYPSSELPPYSRSHRPPSSPATLHGGARSQAPTPSPNRKSFAQNLFECPRTPHIKQKVVGGPLFYLLYMFVVLLTKYELPLLIQWINRGRQWLWLIFSRQRKYGTGEDAPKGWLVAVYASSMKMSSHEFSA